MINFISDHLKGPSCLHVYRMMHVRKTLLCRGNCYFLITTYLFSRDNELISWSFSWDNINMLLSWENHGCLEIMAYFCIGKNICGKRPLSPSVPNLLCRKKWVPHLSPSSFPCSSVLQELLSPHHVPSFPAAMRISTLWPSVSVQQPYYTV